MTFIVGVLIIPFLAIANGQTYSLDNCNSDIEIMDNFKPNLLTGKWYEIYRSHNVARAGTKCFILDFNPSKRDLYDLRTTYVMNEDNNERQVRKAFVVNMQDSNPAIMKFKPGFITEEQPAVMLDTDYKNYAVWYSCLDSYEGKLEFVYVNSRYPKVDNITTAKIDEVLQSRNIHLTLISEVQDCE